MREVELGLVADGFFEPYPSVVRVLEEPESLTERVEVGSGRNLEFQVLPNWNGLHRTWRYPDQRDVRLVLRVTTRMARPSALTRSSVASLRSGSGAY